MDNHPPLPFNELKEFLDFKFNQYNQPAFIETDPIQIPHLFSNPEDIEIAGFLTATIAWGQRKSILVNSRKLMGLLAHEPFSFIMDASDKVLLKASDFVHRTFNQEDTYFFLKALRNIYQAKGGLKSIFELSYLKNRDIKQTLSDFRSTFLSNSIACRTSKHVSDVDRGSSAKRLNMFLRWMVRSDKHGVDFGIWKNIPASALYLPLDLHTGNVSRNLAFF